jgi:hypothetical protein
LLLFSRFCQCGELRERYKFTNLARSAGSLSGCLECDGLGEWCISQTGNIAAAGCLLEFAFGFSSGSGVSGLPGETEELHSGEAGLGTRPSIELERRKRSMFLLLLDFRLPFVGRFKTLVIWLKRR